MSRFFGFVPAALGAPLLLVFMLFFGCFAPVFLFVLFSGFFVFGNWVPPAFVPLRVLLFARRGWFGWGS